MRTWLGSVAGLLPHRNLQLSRRSPPSSGAHRNPTFSTGRLPADVLTSPHEGPGLHRDLHGQLSHRQAERIPMINDPIVDELDRLRAEQMARFNFDFEAFFRDLKEQEKSLPQAVQPPPEPTSTRSKRSAP